MEDFPLSHWRTPNADNSCLEADIRITRQCNFSRWGVFNLCLWVMTECFWRLQGVRIKWHKWGHPQLVQNKPTSGRRQTRWKKRTPTHIKLVLLSLWMPQLSRVDSKNTNVSNAWRPYGWNADDTWTRTERQLLHLPPRRHATPPCPSRWKSLIQVTSSLPSLRSPSSECVSLSVWDS